MSFNVQFTTGAMTDLREANAWYEEKAIGLGERFSEAVLEQSKFLQIAPEKYRLAHRDIRKCSIRRFPYAMYFRVVEDCVVVLAVRGVRQDPAILRERLDRS